MTNESLRRVVSYSLDLAKKSLTETESQIKILESELATYNKRHAMLETEVAELTEALDAIEKAE